MKGRHPEFGPDSVLYRPPAQFFRGSLGRFATGVAVVGFDTEDGPRGVTVNSFTAVSMDPPLVLASIQRTSSSHDLLRGRPFSVNVLGAEQERLARQFGGRAGDVPADAAVWVHEGVAPRLAGVLSWFVCSPWAEYDGGDHTLFLGHVQDFDHRSGDALGFVDGQFTVIHEYVPGHESLF